MIEAEDHHAAVRELRKQGLAILSVELSNKDARAGEEVDPQTMRNRLAKRMTRDDVVGFCQQLSIMLRTGVPLAESLDVFAAQASKKEVGQFITLIKTDVCEGEDFSSVLGKYPRTFPTLLVSLMKAAEASGKLDEMLARVASELAKQRKTTKQIKGAMMYPAIMLIVAILAVTVIMVFVLPKFGPLFKAQGDMLPAPTKVLMWISSFLQHGYFIYVPTLIGTSVGAWYYFRSVAGRRMLDTLKMRAPVVGHMFRTLYVVRFSTTMATLLAAGVSLLDVVRITKEVTGNINYDKMWDLLTERVSHGQDLAPTFREFDFVPRNVVAMIASGEKSGRLPEVLEAAAKAAEEDLEIAVKSTTSMIEPIMIVGMGVVVGGIASAMLMPIFNMSKAMRASTGNH
ncbi:MAG: type II secretion system F family protein [Phycisphaerae bacterium]|nr:type II secretion system F family protein [Phycisphaerae bacterium]